MILSQEDPLEKETATHSSTLAWGIPRTEELGRLSSMGSQSWDTTVRLTFKEQKLFIQSLLQQIVNHQQLHLAETQSQTEGWESFIKKERDGFKYIVFGCCWHGKPEAG